MVGLDTNVVVRLLAQDDPAQLARAMEAIDAQCTADDPGWINGIVLVEVVWVLSSAYRYTRAEIVMAIARLLQVRELEFQYVDEAWEALHLYRDHPADFSDYYLAAINRENGCQTTLTFDGKAARSDLFSLI
jgi:predicted nucleic-acid-binding protein